MTANITDRLQAMPAFAELDAAAIEALAFALDVRDYPAGHTFIREGARGDTIFLLLDGEVSVLREERASEELNRLTAGELFGLVALVDQEPRSATCRAATRCRVGSWPLTVATLLFNQREPIALAFQLALATQLARDFRQLDQRVRARIGARWSVTPE